ncbi:hypothetical protein CFK37_02835 [Virgibacillus phasianinus]|uniref:Uncharacterized protein n=1 Tax=Virgibacillus phasianinus TaxID=2017483 RepID=A0A220TZK0_9BACI|nr:hypothetical protein [Virgibacillus phasianinus]ASK61202.1 hypothetical protein CFK37_02835 [Virgibacillus phasianinus]
MRSVHGISKDKLEKLLWSVALPGFGQLLNKRYVKGIVLIILEFAVNVMSHFNQAIILSFHGKIQEAIDQTNFLWLMFYPCLYFFAIWDAYKDAQGENRPFSFLPFVFSAYFVTVGLILSPTFTFMGQLIGPIWLPILFLPIGIIIGWIIKWILLKISSNSSEPES